MKITMIGGAGVRTPLIIHALTEAQAVLGVRELALFDIDAARVGLIAGLGREIVRQRGGAFTISTPARIEDAADGAEFILSSIRVGGIAARARDERIAIEHGLAGQETTGPGGAAMALRTIPVTLAHARAVERVAPDAWFITFTNPAGLITQALLEQTKLRVIGICDTPIELFHRIAEALGEPFADLSFDYAGLNHLGWVRRVMLRGADVTPRLLADDAALRHIYPGGLFEPELIRALALLPTEYLFFYYSQARAHRNQLKAGASRGEEILRMNSGLFAQIRGIDPAADLETYRQYLIGRNATYMALESSGSAAPSPAAQPDPFDAQTGYHRIALAVMKGLASASPVDVVVNVPNNGAIQDLAPHDVVEMPCAISRAGAHPKPGGSLPETVRGLVQSVKAYERLIIRASLERSESLARLGLFLNPIVGDWDRATQILAAMKAADPDHLGYLR